MYKFCLLPLILFSFITSVRADVDSLTPTRGRCIKGLFNKTETFKCRAMAIAMVTENKTGESRFVINFAGEKVIGFAGALKNARKVDGGISFPIQRFYLPRRQPETTPIKNTDYFDVDSPPEDFGSNVCLVKKAKTTCMAFYNGTVSFIMFVPEQK